MQFDSARFRNFDVSMMEISDDQGSRKSLDYTFNSYYLHRKNHGVHVNVGFSQLFAKQSDVKVPGVQFSRAPQIGRMAEWSKASALKAEDP